MEFDIQRFSDVEVGTSGNNLLRDSDNNTQFYGLSGDDTIESSGRNVILIGGSGNDSLHMIRGSGTLSGGAGADTFSFDYSTNSTLSALIEDIDPTTDRIVINYTGTEPSGWNYKFSGSDLILNDSRNRLNITLQGTRPLDEYYDREGDPKIWKILEEVNEEREDAGLGALTLSKEIMDSASLRADELVEYYSHTRPDGSSCFTALENNIGFRAENIAAGYYSADDVMNGWMHSSGHRANILGAAYSKLGVGYNYDSSSEWGAYWVQMFRSYEYSDEVLSADDLLSTPVVLSSGTSARVTALSALTVSSSDASGSSSLDTIRNTTSWSVVSGTDRADYISNRADHVTIDAGLGDDTINDDGESNVYLYANGDGNDVLLDYDDDNQLRITDGSSYSTLSSGRDVIVSIGSGSITLRDAIEQTINIVGGSLAGSPSDDTIRNTTSWSVVSGTDDADYISNRADHVTIDAGLGDDTIDDDGESNVYLYTDGDGKDVILDYDDDNQLRITDGSSYSTLSSGRDVIVSIGSGSITLRDAIDQTLNIVGGSLAGSPSDDTIRNTTPWSVVSGTDDADYISNRADHVTIDAGLGDDTINDDGESNVYLYANGDGNDVILDYDDDNQLRITDGAKYSTLSSGRDVIVSIGSGSITLKDASDDRLNIVGGSLAGSPSDDTIRNTTSWSVVSGTDDADYISNRADHVTIDAGLGDDTINDDGEHNVYLYADGDGNDVILDYDDDNQLRITDGSSYSTVSSGRDVIVSIGSGSILLKEASDDRLNIVGGSLAGSPSDDTIRNTTPWSVVSGTDDADYIFNRADHVTIDAGLGDDTINDDGESNVYLYANGDGNDVILDYDDDNQLRITDGSTYSTLSSGRDVIVSIGSGSITLKDAYDERLNIVGGSLAGSPSDDTIRNTTSWSVVIGTDDADYISNRADHVTIDAGLGDDTINDDGESNVYLYANGDGNDVILDYDDDNQLRITDGSSYSTLSSGRDVIVSIGSGSITLRDAIDQTINIVGGSLTPTVDPNVVRVDEDSLYVSNTRSNVSIIGTEFDDTIENIGSNVMITETEGENWIASFGSNATILGGEDDDAIFNYAPNASLNGGDGDDTLSTFYGATLTGGDGDDQFRIELANSTSPSLNVRITDLSTEDSFYIGSGITNSFTYSTTDDGLTLRDNVGRINLALDGVTDFNSIAAIEVSLYDFYGNVRTTTTLGAITIAESSGATSLDGVKLNRSGKTITLKDPFIGKLRAEDFGDKVKTINASKVKGAVDLVGNDLNNVIKVGAGGSTVEAGGGKDKITCGDGADVIVYSDGDGKDTIKKFDPTSDVIRLAEGALDSIKVKGKHVVLGIGDGSLTVQKVVGQELSIIDADGVSSTYVFDRQHNDLDSALRSTQTSAYALDDDLLDGDDMFAPGVNYFADSVLVGTDADDTLQNFAGNVTVRGGAGNDYIFSSTLPDYILGHQYGFVTLDGGEGDDTLVSHDPNVSLDGGAGNDLIEVNGWERATIKVDGDDTIRGLGANDVVEYAAGNALVFDFNGDDTLRLGVGASYSTTESGNDVLISLDGGSITLKNALGNRINVINGETPPISIDEPTIYPVDEPTLPAIEIDYSGVKLNRSGKTLKVKSPFSGKLRAEDFGEKVKTMNASTDPNEVELIGNDLNNVLKASKGGSTLDGGLGNDKLYGGAGADLFIYSGGNDQIYKYDDGDRISLGGSIDDARLRGKNLILKVGAGTLTIKHARDRELTFIDADGVMSTYVFDRQHKDFESARMDPIARYWFEPTASMADEGLSVNPIDPLEDILSIESKSIDFESDVVARSLGGSTDGVIISSNQSTRIARQLD